MQDLWNTNKIEEDLETISICSISRFMWNDTLAVLISMLKTAEFKHEDFGWIWMNEWMDGVTINYLLWVYVGMGGKQQPSSSIYPKYIQSFHP